MLADAARSSVGRIVPSGLQLRIRHALTTPRPTQMIIDLCATCNALCPFCPRIYMPPERSKGVMTPELLDRCIDEAKRHGVREIRLYSTSEPTLHPRFDEIVARLKSDGFIVGVSTNAWTLTRHFDSLGKLDNLQYSIEGWDQASYEKFRHPLKFDRVRANVASFWEAAQKLKTRPQITCNLLLTRSTDLQAFVDCWGPFVDRITTSFLMGTTVYRDKRFVTELNDEIAGDYYAHDVDEQGIYGYPFDVVTVSYDGKIALCCEDFSAELPLGHISEGLDRVLESQALKQIRGQFYRGQLDVCRGCNFFRRPRRADVDAVQAQIASLPEAARSKLVFTAG